LQYPEGTKAIKCPVCNTVMQALYSWTFLLSLFLICK
jgi:hypothetical protein